VCSPANQFNIVRKKIDSISEMKEYCTECLRMRLQPEDKEIHLVKNEHS